MKKIHRIGENIIYLNENKALKIFEIVQDKNLILNSIKDEESIRKNLIPQTKQTILSSILSDLTPYEEYDEINSEYNTIFTEFKSFNPPIKLAKEKSTNMLTMAMFPPGTKQPYNIIAFCRDISLPLFKDKPCFSVLRTGDINNIFIITNPYDYLLLIGNEEYKNMTVILIASTTHLNFDLMNSFFFWLTSNENFNFKEFKITTVNGIDTCLLILSLLSVISISGETIKFPRFLASDNLDKIILEYHTNPKYEFSTLISLLTETPTNEGNFEEKLIKKIGVQKNGLLIKKDKNTLNLLLTEMTKAFKSCPEIKILENGSIL